MQIGLLQLIYGLSVAELIQSSLEIFKPTFTSVDTHQCDLIDCFKFHCFASFNENSTKTQFTKITTTDFELPKHCWQARLQKSTSICPNLVLSLSRDLSEGLSLSRSLRVSTRLGLGAGLGARGGDLGWGVRGETDLENDLDLEEDLNRYFKMNIMKFSTTSIASSLIICWEFDTSQNTENLFWFLHVWQVNTAIILLANKLPGSWPW